MGELIKADRSVVIACDVSFPEAIVAATWDIPGIGGYKIGIEAVLRTGLDITLKMVRRNTDLPLIYDHQKGGTDIPEMGPKFAKSVAGVDAVILFPFGGVATERQWIKACRDEGLVVLVGGHMTQPEFLWAEGGFIADDAPERIYRIAIQCGVRDFVVPGNKVEFVAKYRQLFETELGEGNFTLYAPGFVAQGGVISETGKMAGKNWHAIVGSAIYKAPDMAAAAREITSQII